MKKLVLTLLAGAMLLANVNLKAQTQKAVLMGLDLVLA